MLLQEETYTKQASFILDNSINLVATQFLLFLRSPDSRGTPSDFSNLTEKAKESSIWKGFVMMQNVAKFGTNVFLVSGPGENLVQVLPDTLYVAGRIAHKHVWDYVKQCKTSSSRVSDWKFGSI